MKSSLEKHWNIPYDNARDFTLISANEISDFLHFVSPQAPKKCLDIGCGTGQLTRELFHRGYTTTGVDIASSAIGIAQSLTTVSASQLNYLQLNIEHTSITRLDPPYGLITCKLVYAFIQNKRRFLAKVIRLLAPSGSFIVVTPLKESVPSTKQTIVASHADITLLESTFPKNVQYKMNGFLYFVGSCA